MDVANKAPLSDDEEDLDMLRLAALQTLKRNAPPSQGLSNTQKWPRNDSELPYRSGNRSHGQFPNKRGRFYGGRGSKNGQFHNSNHRPVSSNLISLTPSVPREDLKPSHLKQEGISESTLLLPQDKYSKKSTQVTEIHSRKSDETSSKFDRYKDSDKSEEEDSEDEILKSESDDDSLLKRSDSLEALMRELDDEIQGKPKAKDKEEKPAKGKIKTKRKKDVSKTETEEEEEENKLKSETVAVSVDKSKELEPELVKKDSEVSKSPKKVDDGPGKPAVSKDAIKNRERSPEQEPQPKKRRHSPSQRGFRGTYRGKHRDFGRSNLMHNSQFLPGNGPLPFHPNNPLPIFNKPPFGPPNLMMNPPPLYENTLSPLLIDTESLQTQTMAPLSPRSAAFVLQNRAIVEKRKRSPRRSYSRSPSPRRRSVSPRRSLTPPGRRSQSPRKRSLSPRKRSLSPRKRSLSPPPLRKRSRSPPKRRSMSPKRRSPSPKRRNFSPKQRPLSPKLRPFSPKRRSLSPKRRPLSPKQRPLSPKARPFSPKRRSISPKRRPLSPKQRPLSPKSRTFSPKRRSLSPKRRSPSPRRRERKDASENLLKNKPSVRDRLGLKSSSKPEEKDTKEKPSADVVSPRSKDGDKPLDPILEARKKKFETREINVREGMIRLKPKVDAKTAEKTEQLKSSEVVVVVESSKEHENAPAPSTDENVDESKKGTSAEGNDIDEEEGLLEDDELDLEAQLDLFSDEETGSENEGRFKVKEESGAAKPVVLPFTKLVNGATLEVKRGLLNDSRPKRVETQSRSPREKTKDPISPGEKSSRSDSSRRSKTTRLPKTTDKEKSSSTRRKLGVKCERHPKRFERKIEIKIKNPSKYERIDKADAAKDVVVKGEKERASSRRVELGTVTAAAPRLGADDDDDDETEIVVENDEDENSVGNEGDLRAQLSKKRAEKKLQKSSTSRAGVSSRLLQNALENALPIKKSKKSKSSKELSSSDGKLPIHRRLGLACSSDVFTKLKKKSKKRKNIASEDQV